MIRASQKNADLYAGDALIVERAMAGDQRAFAAVLHRHRPELRASVARIVRRPADVDDVLQEVAIAAWRSIARLEDPACVRAWLFRIAARKAFAALRDRPPLEPLRDELPARADDHAWSDLRHDLRSALAMLPELQARVWTLREVDGLSYLAIADRVGVPDSTVRGALVQARRKLLASMRTGGWRPDQNPSVAGIM